jgi:hypothetical protein
MSRVNTPVIPRDQLKRPSPISISSNGERAFSVRRFRVTAQNKERYAR